MPSRTRGFSPWVGQIPWTRKRQPTAVCLPGEFHGQRRLAGCHPWGPRELDTTQRLHSSSMYTPHSFLTLSSTDRSLGCFHLLPPVNNTAMNMNFHLLPPVNNTAMNMNVPFLVSASCSFVYILRSEISESHASSSSNFLRSHQDVSHSSFTTLNSYHQCSKVAVSTPHPHLLFCFLTEAFLRDVTQILLSFILKFSSLSILLYSLAIPL